MKKTANFQLQYAVFIFVLSCLLYIITNRKIKVKITGVMVNDVITNIL